jgi:hypothetical protein
MKINKNLLILAMGILLISCGGKNAKDNSSSDINETTDNDCACNELNLDTVDSDGKKTTNWKDIKKNGSNELFTGFCFEKDQNDSIINKIEIKNGWVVRKIWREKINDKYIVTADYSYENSKVLNSWEIYIDKGDVSDTFPGYYYIRKFEETKNGKPYNNWEISASSDGIYKISTVLRVKNGVNISDSEQVPPKCMPNSEKGESSEYLVAIRRFLYSQNQFTINDISPEDYFKTLDCLKGEFVKFEYWKLK